MGGDARAEGGASAGQGGRQVFIVDREGEPIHSRRENTILAGLALWPTYLSVETSSVRRADDAREMLEKHVPGMVRFRRRRDGTAEWLITQLRNPDSSAIPPHP